MVALHCWQPLNCTVLSGHFPFKLKLPWTLIEEKWKIPLWFVKVCIAILIVTKWLFLLKTDRYNIKIWRHFFREKWEIRAAAPGKTDPTYRKWTCWWGFLRHHDRDPTSIWRVSELKTIQNKEDKIRDTEDKDFMGSYSNFRVANSAKELPVYFHHIQLLVPFMARWNFLLLCSLR